MKRIACAILTALILFGALGLSSCQKVFTYSPFAPILGQNPYVLPAEISFQDALLVADEAISSGDAALSATVLDNLIQRYEGLTEAEQLAALPSIVKLALITTNVSYALIQAMSIVPAEGAELSEAQTAQVAALMATIKVSESAMAAFGLMASAEPGTVEGGDFVFAGLALIQAAVGGQQNVLLEDLPMENQMMVFVGSLLIASGVESLTAAGADTSLLEGIIAYVGL